MRREPPISTTPDSLFPYATLFRSQAGQQIREAEYVCFNHLGLGVGAASIERTGARQSGSEQSCFYFQFCNPGRDLLPAIDFTLIGHYRSEERRVGTEFVSTCRSRWSPYH